MKAMRKTVAQNDVSAWAGKFLDELASGRHEHDKSVRPARRS
jgi:trehalose 6-phosphate synthase